MGQTAKLGKRATTLFTEDGFHKVIYHDTCVIKWSESEIVLDSGGWNTLTTKTRINQASNQFDLGVRVSQKDFEWFVEFKGQTLEFNDKMTINRETGEVS